MQDNLDAHSAALILEQYFAEKPITWIDWIEEVLEN
jgi:hypothetical protein